MRLRPLLMILPLLLLAPGCHRNEQASTPPGNAGAMPRAVQSLPAPSSAVTIQTTSGQTAFQITPRGDELVVSFTADGTTGSLERKQHTSGKRKYAQNGQLIAEVKPDESGFKVRSPDGKQLYWKLKREADKVKISDNEQNEHPFVLKSKSDRIEVLGPDGTKLGAVRYDAASQRAVVEDASGQMQFTMTSTRADRFLGVALMTSIPIERRAILMAELASLDRITR